MLRSPVWLSSSLSLAALIVFPGCETLSERAEAAKIARVNIKLEGVTVLDEALRTMRTPFARGPQNFRPGDSIMIGEVMSSSPSFEVGARVVVSGWYALTSEKDARLGLFVTTASGGPQPNSVLRAQMMTINGGTGVFQVECDVQTAGLLHLSFYGNDGGPFGRVYFGTAEQMAQIGAGTF